MQKLEPSRTAETAAAPRALESQKPVDQRICDDPFAEKFLKPTFTLLGKTRVPKFLANWMYERILPGFFGFTVARTRNIDEIVQKFLIILILLWWRGHVRAEKQKCF